MKTQSKKKNHDQLERIFHNCPQEFLWEFANCGINIHSKEFLTSFPAWAFDELHARNWNDQVAEFFYPKRREPPKRNAAAAKRFLEALKGKTRKRKAIRKKQ